MRIRLAFALLFTAVMGFAGPPEKVGVLVLAHGGSESWNQLVIDAARTAGKQYPVEVAFGMALPRTIQEGIDKLEGQGVNKIVVVPLFVSSYSFIIRQTEYLLGKREVLADPPMVMDHSPGAQPGSAHGSSTSAGSHSSHSAAPADGGHGSHGDASSTTAHTSHSSHGESAPTTLERLNFKSEIIMTQALDDNSIVADILFDRIKELSSKPTNETVIIVGHGPNPEEDNKNWVKSMESLAAQVQEKQKKAGASSRLILSVTVRDDADKEIYDQAKEHLRGLVRQAGKQGDVIVVPLLLSKGGVEQGIVKRLDGLTYKWSGNTLLPDPQISKFIEVSVSGALKK
jgi:sirohydrochlorin cobaltochelatase